MSDEIIPVPGDWKKRAHVGALDYASRYAELVKDPDGFWRKEAGGWTG